MNRKERTTVNGLRNVGTTGKLKGQRIRKGEEGQRKEGEGGRRGCTAPPTGQQLQIWHTVRYWMATRPSINSDIGPTL